jgi:menaquinone-dependent protoporphyrinogen IX oxidase
MRVAVVFFSGKNREKIRDLANGLAKGIEKQGNQVDVFDGGRDNNVKLTVYQYIAIGMEPSGSFSGKVPDFVRSFLAGSGMVSGKKSYAFVCRSTFGTAKSLTNLMRSMEGEGMFLKNSDVLRSSVEAEEVGKRLHIS